MEFTGGCSYSPSNLPSTSSVADETPGLIGSQVRPEMAAEKGHPLNLMLPDEAVKIPG